MRENPFLFESEETENESQFEDSSEFFENEYEDEGEYEETEYEDEYDEAEYEETEYDEAEYDETEYDETAYEGEYEDEFRGGRSFRAPARSPRSLNRFRQHGARRARPQFRPRPQFRARPQFRLQTRPQTRPPRPRQSWRQWRRRPQYPVPYPYYSSRPMIPSYGEPAPHSSEMVRLLQSLLNKTLGLNLPVDGVMNVETRSAIRSFQNPVSALPIPSGGDPAPAPASDAGGEGAPPPDAPPPAEEFEFEFAYPGANYGEFEDEYFEQEMYEGETAKKSGALRYLKGFASPDAECADAFKRAKKTRAEALTIIDTQIGRAIRMLRFAAGKLKRGSRTAQTKALFKKIFRVTPEFVPTWMKPTASIKDRGDVVATRCARVADMLESGGLRYFCTLSKKNCPDCSDPKSAANPYACSSWGKHRVVCLHKPFWDAMGKGDLQNVLAVLMHEPFHVYYGRYVTEHGRTVNGKAVSVGKFGGIYCILQFVFEINKAKYPLRIKSACDHTTVRI